MKKSWLFLLFLITLFFYGNLLFAKKYEFIPSDCTINAGLPVMLEEAEDLNYNGYLFKNGKMELLNNKKIPPCFNHKEYFKRICLKKEFIEANDLLNCR